MSSSVIRSHRYAPEVQLLTIVFVSGRRYVYADVPPEVAAEFAAAASQGSYFNAHIRDRYRFAEL